MPLSDERKAAWNFVHGIYRNPPVSEQNKKIAWNRIHKVYGGLPLISPMSKAHAPQKEEIPEREVDMGVKPISATAPPAGVSRLDPIEAIHRLVEKRIDRELEGQTVLQGDLSSGRLRYLVDHIIGDNDAITKARQKLTTKHGIVPGSGIDEHAEAYWIKKVKEMMAQQEPAPKKVAPKVKAQEVVVHPEVKAETAIVRPEVQTQFDKISESMVKLTKKEKTGKTSDQMDKLRKKLDELSYQETRAKYPGVWENWGDIQKTEKGRKQKEEWARYNTEYLEKMRDDYKSRNPKKYQQVVDWVQASYFR
jgi:hypothetical protein